MSEPNLNEFERRLSTWRPASDSLDADAMLYAAGRASVRRSPARFAWPAIAACLALSTGILGHRLANQQAENRALMARLTPAKPSATVTEEPSAPLPQTSYLAARRALEADPNGWAPAPIATDHELIDEPTLRAGQRELELTR